ncbi:hypothetical protein G5714_021174 [Onychostoma macrolepis]|uniref:Caspase-1 n=1 Tax=Onychostoma macrolepis TaxID=369639 RepID=A0A7J6BQI3_9TELE|nr:hypothetical protein G5714_021174 [Onychostoma macrolepis]
MAEASENWDEYSEDTMIKILKNLSLHKTLLKQSDGNSEGRALTGRDFVKLPCNHRRPAHYIIAWFKYCLKQRRTSVSSPREICATSKLVQAACLTWKDEMRETCVCTAPSAQPTRNTYNFCWSCQSEWKGPTHNALRCSNSGCGQEVATDDPLVLCTPEFKERKLSKKRADIYPMKESSPDRKRLALLINNVEFEYINNRAGAEKDELGMERLLKGLGYTVLTLRDLTAQGMSAAMQDFAQREEHCQSDSCFVLFMSHGSATGICGVSSIVNSDRTEDIFSTDEIYNCLNTTNCPGLRDKPKIILIQSCRGGNDGCVDVQDSIPKQEHREKDFCCLRSSTPDTVSYRSPQRGSDFFQDIVEIFNAHAHEDHIEELFRKVLKKFKENHPCQMPCKDRTTLSKKFYLFPGL